MMKVQNIFRLMILAVVAVLGLSARAQKIYYVSPTATGTGDGTSWSNTTTLTDALNKAVAGEQIWVKGFETISSVNELYITPDVNGFILKSGVQLYGGFKGDERSANDRETLGKPYQMRYRSVLSGDISRNDQLDANYLIFPQNATRGDNALHVLQMNLEPSSGVNNNAYPTVVNGFTVANGQAAGSGDQGKGGGIRIYGDNSRGGVFRVERCFVVNNYGALGGGIYIDAAVKHVNNNTSLINQSVIYNNVAGTRSLMENAGGGLWADGRVAVVNSSIFNNENGGVRIAEGGTVVNATVARNTAGGIDLTAEKTGSEYDVSNTIIWGNTRLFAACEPKFRNSAFHEVEADDQDGNIYVTTENKGFADSPMFDGPSLKTSFDREYNWRMSAYPVWSWNVLIGSVMLDKGNPAAYQTAAYGNSDMAGNARVSRTIDIGAYEYQYLESSRIRYVKQGATGDGSSWNNASGDLQKMIDELADNNQQGLLGEVWVAAGTYSPIGWLDPSKSYTAAFRMRDGISVYGGFAGNEQTKEEREKDGDLPWQYKNKTILKGASYEGDAAWNETDYLWNISSSASRHVVWFAPYPYNEKDYFKSVTILNGVTILGGNAQGDIGVSDFLTDRGGGVFLGRNCHLMNSIVKECYAKSDGGAVCLKGGRVIGSLVFNSSAESRGGGIYMDNAGLILQSMISNCSATDGGGVYLDRNALWDGMEHPEYLILSTSIVTNNTNKANGAVYCNDGGVITQTIIARNNTIRAIDLSDNNAAQTGGLYVNKYALAINSVVWGNDLKGNITTQTYVKDATQEKVRFYNVGVSNFNSSVWNNVLLENMISLSDNNMVDGADGEGYISPNFTTDGMPSVTGVDPTLKDLVYFWKPIVGSNLRAKGMMLGTFPDEVMAAPEVDIDGHLFQQTPALGAYKIDATPIVPEVSEDGNTLRVYVDTECTIPGHDGSSWEKGYRSLNEALEYLGNLSKGVQEINGRQVDVNEDTRLELYVLEGNLRPRFVFTNLDAKSVTVRVPEAKSGATFYVYGGYRRNANDPNQAERKPLVYRTIINGNYVGKDVNDGIYHCITVMENAKVHLDGFQVINGHALGESSRQYGAGLLAHTGSEVTLKDCIFENNTAQDGAAVDARNATLNLINCVINNNTNVEEGTPVVNARTLTVNHVTVVNNIGAAPAAVAESATSFAVGNSSGNTVEGLASVGEEGAKVFANPANQRGATLGFNTYYGGYSEYRPLTSSADAAVVINQGSNSALTQDITGSPRNLGGAPDKGAYEAILPESGRVYYVRKDGNDNNDGLSWGHALATLGAALNKAAQYPTVNSRPQIWVAEGVYTGTIKGSQTNVNDPANLHKQPYAFKMVEGVNVYGGFPADGVPGENDRDPNQYPTVLQAAQNEGPSKPASNVRSVGRVLVQPDHFTVETVWDGFVIQHGFLYSSARLSIIGNIMNVNVEELGNASGAGVFLMGNGVLENCIVRKNKILGYDQNIISDSGGQHGAGGGVYCHGGVIKNCQILENSVKVYTVHNSGANEAAFTYGGGLYMLNHVQDRDYNNDYIVETGILHKAAIYNSIIANNTLYAGRLDPTLQVNFHTMAVGAGACQVSGDFYNNTIVNNEANTGWARCANVICGGMFVYSTARIYNSVIVNNNGYYDQVGNHAPKGIAKDYMHEQIISFYMSGENGNSEDNDSYSVRPQNIDVHFSDVGRRVENNGVVSFEKDKLLEYGNVTYESRNNICADPLFVDEENDEFHLKSGSPAINTGTDYIEGVIIPDYDAEYTDRIKDCAIDMGAFESQNEGNIGYATVGEGSARQYVYHVTQNGKGLRSGASADNAACAMKLQQILLAAGTLAATTTEGQVYVRVAGYNPAENPFVYHANTLSEANDPQSYTYVVPEGVILEGGYSEDFTTRNPMLMQTRLSAVKEATLNQQEVNGYHVITFMDAAGNKDLQVTELTKKTIVDGLFLEDGKAESDAGSGNTKAMGGGAIVPKGAHVRNCVIKNCQALQGGGLYLMPGAMVSGSLLQLNEAEDGAGIFASGTDIAPDNRSYLISSTVTDNTATGMGGGIYQEDGALMGLNSVIWGNAAPSDRNVSGVVTAKFTDHKLLAMVQTLNPDQVDETYYPYNYCFVETFEMPSSFENTSMTSEEDIYFEDDRRFLKVYSPMIKRGILEEYLTYWQQNYQVAESDMNNILRLQTDYQRADAGAFAYNGGPLQIDQLITRIFVSKGTNVHLAEGEKMETYLGRSFYTSLNHLDDAIEYIKRVREEGIGGAGENTVFEILLGPGIYKPSVRRMDAATTILDQRQNSFVLPKNVKIYGGFSGEENYATGINRIPAASGDIELSSDGDIQNMLNARGYSDLNGNSVLEPWELSYHAILSGELDVSVSTKHVYHVVYSSGEGDVTLDGLTIMNGETLSELSSSAETDEIGRGGAIYSNGMNYTLHRCRLMNNRAVRGGSMYMRNANATLIGCVVAGNGPVEDFAQPEDMRGGGIYIAGNIGTNSKPAALYAVNTLFANNETSGSGGAVAGNEASVINLMNCNLVRNKAKSYGAAYSMAYSMATLNNVITNTVIWGNEDEGTQAVINDPQAAITYSASEWLATDKNAPNIRLNTDNQAVDGPRFKKPSEVAGVSGNSSSLMWNPAALSVLADVGNGTYAYDTKTELGAYKEWFEQFAPDYQGQYMKDLLRYAAPLNEEGQVPNEMVIDIGLFEYPHPVDLSKLDAVYVATEDAGLANGTSWAHAISNLKLAIIAMANPTGSEKTKEKKIYVRDGVYTVGQLSHDNVAFPLYASNDNTYGTSLEIVGSCTGVGHEQDFSKPTVLTVNPVQQNTTNILLDIRTENKPVTVSGLTFVNSSQGDGTAVTMPGRGVNIMDIGAGAKVTLKNVAFRNNYGYGISSVENKGELLIANALFADGAFADDSTGVGLQTVGKTTVVNATFAQNRKDIEVKDGTPAPVVRNSVSWNNEVQNLSDAEGTANVSFPAGTENNDIQNGPNFINPMAEDVLERDYGIRPSLNLLNRGDNEIYNELVLDELSAQNIPATERDLANNSRQTGTKVDVGAYEYSADLQQVIYVKPVVGGNGTGESWANATSDLQGAIDLVAVYAANNPGSKGYVFVHNTQPINNRLRVSMPGTMIYGSMNDEVSDQTDVEGLVSDLVNKRQGILQNNRRTQISQGLDITASSVVDGFEIAGGVQLGNDGCLSTSIVKGPVQGVTGGTTGLLYNTLVTDDATGTAGSVNGVQAVNVTATDTIADMTDNANNRASVTETNAYVTDNYWNYQLMETSADIDGGKTDIASYMDMVGHDRDLIGNLRVRHKVDNGCFETWNISKEMTSGNVITAEDYPLGKSVVYVRKGQELKIENASDGTLLYPAGNSFTPGFLLLEHQAGLRGNGNHIRLTNFAVERDVPNGKSDLVAMPFDVNSVTSVLKGITPKRYNGSLRATYDYKFDQENSKAWTDQNIDQAGICEGLLFENTTGQDQTLRFYGKSTAPYVEDGNDKQIELTKYNFNEQWTTDDQGNVIPSGSNRFTYKENMSWNLFGSPYLCAMNYSDLEYGRVLYGYQDGYQTIRTYDDNGVAVDGYIPAGSAVFTQSATLKDSEVFDVAQPAGTKTGEEYASEASLILELTSAGKTRAVRGAADCLLLNPVSAELSRSDFDLSADGVKWLADSVMQIYADRAGGRYSLLSGVSREGEVAVSLSLPQAGSYELSLPEDRVFAYDEVMLEDRKTGRTVNLMEKSYPFAVQEAGELSGRFILSFKAKDGIADGCKVRIMDQGNGQVLIYGLQSGDRITVYDPSGIRCTAAEAQGTELELSLKPGVFVFEILRGAERKVMKSVLR